MTVVISSSALVAMIAAGCSSGSGSVAASGAPTAASQADNPAAASPAAAPSGGNDAACKLVTKAEATKLVPGIGDGVVGVAGGGGSMCKFTGPKHAEFNVQLENGKQYYVGNIQSSGNLDVPGVGDKAFVTAGGMSFGILKGDKALMVYADTGIGGGTVPDAATNLAITKALMPVVASRM